MNVVRDDFSESNDCQLIALQRRIGFGANLGSHDGRFAASLKFLDQDFHGDILHPLGVIGFLVKQSLSGGICLRIQFFATQGRRFLDRFQALEQSFQKWDHGSFLSALG